MNKKIAAEIIFLSVIISLLHLIATKFYLYWTTDWFDIIMHFLGGAVIGLIVYWLMDWVSFLRSAQTNVWTHLSLVLSGVLIIGLGWELFELFVGFTDPVLDRADTISDLIMDTLGGLAIFKYAKNRFK